MTSARIQVANIHGKFITCRTLLDTCSTSNFITVELMKRLKLPKSSCSLSIGAMNGLSTTAKHLTTLTFKSIHSEFKKTLIFYVIPTITDLVPNEVVPRDQLNIPHNLKLADPDFHKPAIIDLLIGAGPTLSMFCTGQIHLSSNSDLILQKTKLGWIVGGNIHSIQKHKASKCMFTNLQFDLEKFWAIEEVHNTNSNWSEDEINCENHFKKYVKRNEEGRYIVALPFKKTNTKLGESRQTALKRLTLLQKRFHRNIEFESQYTQVIHEYLEANHMSLARNEVSSGYYLPHHAVIKNSSNTTKLRVVFDASAKSSNGTSLNDCFLVGPTIQNDLFSILTRFRLYNYVIIADIEKMYRQFLIREEDRDFQRILWSDNDQVREYTLNTVTFGVASAPFLAIRCLHQLADDEGEAFPLAAKILKKDLYVDNMLTGTNSKREAREICEQMINILAKARIKMRQWASNNSDVIQGISNRDLDINFNLDPNYALKTLGIYWKARHDVFIYEIKTITIDNTITKRKILSEIAKIFDPIGLLGPIILFAKKLMQDIWQAKIQWDESVPNNISFIWHDFCNQLNSLNSITFDRQVVTKDAQKIELHGFCDASEVGYGACIYLRSQKSDKLYNTSLLCSKSRVAPLKTRTMPRLELCAAQLLANLYQRVIQALDIEVYNTFFWSDSSITLNWINTSPNLLKTFVANRVAEIQLKTKISDWKHIRSHHNPADALSRGQLPNEFLNNSLWLHGPSWLNRETIHWPNSNIPGIDDIPEKRKACCLLINSYLEHIFNILNKFSSYSKLLCIIAICLRFFKRYHTSEIINLYGLRRAEILIIKLVQKSVFNDEIQSLKNQKTLIKKSRLTPLDPFIDKKDILRVGGRIHKAIIPFSKRHPIILPRNHHVTDIIIRYYHILNLHTGVQNTLYAIREKFWIIDGRNQVRRVIRKCVSCFRARPHLVDYKMGNLPSTRIRQSRPFNQVGIDYCGPFYIKEKKYRNKNIIKSYAAIFVCMTVKAVHIEIVEDLSTDAFMGALRRFVARRGLPENIYSDNGTNFRGAHNQLSDLYDLLQSQDLKMKLKGFTINNRVQWHFIPPHAPNFGGLWEIMVKQFKHHFKRVAYDKRFTFVEFMTFSSEVEAILNSRPLTQMSTDVNDFTALTPGHFLIGDSLRALPEHDYTRLPSNRLNAWENLSKIKRDFWTRWHKEYLSELNVRHKRNMNTPNLKEGLLVLIKEDDTPSMEWSMGRIHELHPGTDNIVRTVTIKIKNGMKKRPTTKIAVLPIEDQSEENQKL